jgi:serine/threonine protein kinase
MSTDLYELGPYRIVRPVGRGGMGVVYEAVHTGLDKRVALKVLAHGLAADRLERFLREARTAAGLHHTNIVPVFDAGEVVGVPRDLETVVLKAMARAPADRTRRAGRWPTT